MKKKYFILIFFIFMVLSQLFVVTRLIYKSNGILESGKELKFKIGLYDPVHPFMGKYIELNFENNSIVLPHEHKWNLHDKIYVHVNEDSNGFARIASISKEIKPNSKYYFKSKINNIHHNYNNSEISIEFPFNKYFLEETEAKLAEDIYNKIARDSANKFYLLVKIKDGDARIKDIYVNDTLFSEYIKTYKKTNK